MLHFLNDWWKFIQIHQYYTTVHAGELGPLGKFGPDNIQLNEIGFFLLLQ